MKRKKWAVAGLVLVSLAVATPAIADIYSYYYDVTMPIGQQPRNTGVQTKTNSSQAGSISPSFITGSYNIDAQMCSLSGLYCGGGTKVYNIQEGWSVSLPNTYSASGGITVNIQPSTWNAGNVRATGYSSVK